MHPKSAKAKGDKFEKFILGEIRKHLDPKAKQTKASGAGLDKGDLYCPSVDWLIEAKCHKKINLKEWIAQTESQDNDAVTSMCVFKSPLSPDNNPDPYVLINLYDLIDLFKQNSTIVTEEEKDNRQLAWKLSTLKNAIKQLEKEL